MVHLERGPVPMSPTVGMRTTLDEIVQTAVMAAIGKVLAAVDLQASMGGPKRRSPRPRRVREATVAGHGRDGGG